jgi:hypothetical protein
MKEEMLKTKEQEIKQHKKIYLSSKYQEINDNDRYRYREKSRSRERSRDRSRSRDNEKHKTDKYNTLDEKEMDAIKVRIIIFN